MYNIGVFTIICWWAAGFATLALARPRKASASSVTH